MYYRAFWINSCSIPSVSSYNHLFHTLLIPSVSAHPFYHHSIVQAFISIRLDYIAIHLCTSSTTCSDSYKATQNAAARRVTGVRWSEHNTPVLRQLHWLYRSGSDRFQTGGVGVQSTASRYTYCTYQRTANSLPLLTSASCDRQQSTHVRSSRQGHLLAIVPLLAPAWDSGTVCQYICDSWIYRRWAISTGTKNVSVCGCMTAAYSYYWLLFFRRWT